MTTDTVGSYIAVFTIENGGKYHVEASYWDELDAVYHQWVERRIDRVLSLTSTDGGPVLIAASRLDSVTLVTPESRAKSRVIEAAMKAEAGFTE